MRRLVAPTLLALLAGCAVPHVGFVRRPGLTPRAPEPGSDVVTGERGRATVRPVARQCSSTRRVPVDGVWIGTDGVALVGCLTSALTDTIPGTTPDGRTPRPPVP